MENELLLQEQGMEEKMNSTRKIIHLFAHANWIEVITLFFQSSHAIVVLLMAFSLVSCTSIEQAASMRSHPRCEIHGCRMEHTMLILDEYAGRKMPESFYAARGGIFPHTGTAFPVCAFYPNRDMTWRCSECVRAGRIWCDEHLRNQPFL
jgi:hypothetical protein